MTVNAVKQRSGRADFDTVAALRTIQPTAVCADYGIDAAVAGLDGVLAHPFVTDACAAFAENAPLRVVGDYRREIFFGLGVLFL